jgi:phosphatidylserine/phosphatidylglycerophosphate/cardiolipin synthase-like enzyme
VGRTLGQGPLLYGNDGQGPDQVHYAFAPGGEKSARALITNAIQNAKKFIYLEDQYFVSQEAADLLATALKNGVAHVTIVVPHHKISDLPLSVGHRRKCIQTLRDADPSGNRVRVFYKCGPNQTPGDFETYVHAKMTIIDDEFAVVGTVNYNRRSWHYDTEINIGVFDPSSDRVLTSRFAHWLRMRMWAEHLFGVKLPPSPPDGGVADIDRRYAELVDGVAAGAQWLELIKLQQKWEAANPGTPSQQYDQSQFNSVATVRPYDLHANDPPEEIYAANDIFLLKVLNSEFGWDHFLDPEHP